MRETRRRTTGFLGLVLIAVMAMLGTGVTPAAAAPSTPPESVLADQYRTDERGALARLELNTKYTDYAAAMAIETFADIVCHDNILMTVQDKGWGVQYPAGQLKVYRDLFIHGDWWKTTENYPWTSSGSWSTPTGEHSTLIDDEEYMLWVTTYPYAGGARIGRDTDTCDM